MSSGITALREEFGATIAALAGALAAGDEARFLEELDSLVQRRERALFGELRKLTGDLQAALERFRVDSRLMDLAEKEVPDARHREREPGDAWPKSRTMLSRQDRSRARTTRT